MKVLGFHTISDPTNFEKILVYLKNKYTILDIHQFEKIVVNKEEGVKCPLLITFDDGDESIYKQALPLLIKYQIPAVVFVVTDLINTHTPFWWDEIEYYMGKPSGSEKVWEVKKWPNSQRVQFLNSLRKRSKKPLLTHRQLTTSELNEMKVAGITIANHSYSHPMLDQCTATEIEKEIDVSKEYLDALGFRGDLFAYPNGNFSLVAEKILKEKGIKIAFLFDHKINKKVKDPHRISRLIVNDTTSLWKTKLILSGWHTKILPITKRIGKLRK